MNLAETLASLVNLVNKYPEDRELHMQFAQKFGYFWIPCEICGNNFGGHEPFGILYGEFGQGHAVCINCKSRAADMNERRLKEWDEQYKIIIANNYFGR